MKMTLIRHFPTAGNRERRYIGVTDEELDVSGLPETFPEYPAADLVIVSPMKRCRQTAELLYPGIKQIACDDLRECDFGRFEGKNYEELKNNPYYQKWLDSVGKIPFPGGEDHTEFVERCVKGAEQMVNRLLRNECRETGTLSVAFVVHGGTIMALMEAFAEDRKDFYSWQVKNGEGFRVTVNEADWESGRKIFTEIERL